MAPAAIAANGSPLLDRVGEREMGDRYQYRPDDPEYHSGSQHHVQARDGDDVIDTCSAQIVVGRLRNETALARDERRGDRTGRAADDVGDPRRKCISPAIDGGRDFQVPRWRVERRRERHWPGDRSDSANPHEEGFAREIIAARPGGFRRGQKPCDGRNRCTRFEARTARNRHPDPEWHLGRRKAVDRYRADEKARAGGSDIGAFNDTR